MAALGPSGIALVVGALLVAGAAASGALTARAARRIPRSAALMAGVTAWVVLFGLVPLTGFALVVPRAGRPGAAAPAGWEALVLNLVPFALVCAPLAGFVQALRATSPKRGAPGDGPGGSGRG